MTIPTSIPRMFAFQIQMIFVIFLLAMFVCRKWTYLECTCVSFPVLPSYMTVCANFVAQKWMLHSRRCARKEKAESSNLCFFFSLFSAVKWQRLCENMARVGTLVWHTSTSALAIRWPPPSSLCWWNASKDICRSSAGNHHSRTFRSFNPSAFPGGGAMAVSSMPSPSDVPVVVGTPVPHILSSTSTMIWYHTAITVEDIVNKSTNNLRKSF